MSTWFKVVMVASGGALGALLRTGVGGLIVALGQASFFGTLAANLIGCFLMGMGHAAIELYDWGSPQARAFIFSGFLGAFTTFSTFEADTAALWRGDEPFVAAFYMGGSVAGGVVCFMLGWWLLGRIV